ncbi:hypothetical protein QE152_g37337 [Popillia japonica]|uniref:Uncharacterized protein n=1 Tax=Popillia japonica TaxID=7064 RepID=A0AAW1IAV6_POPJA
MVNGGCRDGSNLLCPLCLQEKTIIEERKSSYVGQKRAAEKTLELSAQKFKPIELDTSVKVAIPKVDWGPLDKQNLLGQVMKLENGVYRIRTKSGIIKAGSLEIKLILICLAHHFYVHQII